MTPSPINPYHPRLSRERTSGSDDFVVILPCRDHVGVALSDHSGVMVQICKGRMRIVMAHLEHRSSGPLNLLHEAQPVEIKV